MQKLLFKNFFNIAVLYILCNCLVIRAEQKNVLSDDNPATDVSSTDVPFSDVYCKSVTIRSTKDFNTLQNCTVVLGYVRIVESFFTRNDYKQLKPSNIEEISEYLLVYRVNGLDSLDRLFPKLIVIRGVQLLYDEYALVILENRNLKNIGLVSLLRVLKGSIRIEKNPSLCFVNTINWVWILGNQTKEYHYDANNNKPADECPLCYTYEDGLNIKQVNRHKRCWSQNRFQKTLQDYVGHEKCEGTSSNCLTACSDHNCRHCTYYLADEGCVDFCSPWKYKLAYKRQCVTNCTERNLFELGLECVEKCPKYFEVMKFNGPNTCGLNCEGDFIIHTAKDLEGLGECVKIKGSITIELHDTEKHIVEHLEKAFRNINEVTDYIKILNSPPIVSLHMFQNLHTIGGSKLLENRYSLYVVDNQFLQELFPINVVLTRGCFYFHLNPRLCYEKIIDLEERARDCNDLTIKDASQSSNGERSVCGEMLKNIDTVVADYNSDSALIVVEILKHMDYEVLVGYVYYYKEAPFRNVTRFDGRHGCGKDSWFTDIDLNKRARHVIQNLKPATQYAYFVNSMINTDYHHIAEHVSEIKYFTTSPAKPEMVAKMYYYSVSASEIEIHWWPPRIKNGIIEKYVLQFEETNTTIPSVVNNQTMPELCQCPKLHTQSYIPTPHASSYYNKESKLYLDSIQNFIYVKKQVVDNTTNTSNTTTSTPTNSDPTSTSTTTTNTVKRDTNNATEDERSDELYKFITDFNLRRDMAAFIKQNAEKEIYDIPHPDPICNDTSSATTNQTEIKCVPLEKFEGAIEIPGNRHVHKLDNLEPEKSYRISLRACVKDLPNGCGPARVILAKTVSRRMAKFLKEFRTA